LDADICVALGGAHPHAHPGPAIGFPVCFPESTPSARPLFTFGCRMEVVGGGYVARAWLSSLERFPAVARFLLLFNFCILPLLSLSLVFAPPPMLWVHEHVRMRLRCLGCGVVRDGQWGVRSTGLGPRAGRPHAARSRHRAAAPGVVSSACSHYHPPRDHHASTPPTPHMHTASTSQSGGGGIARGTGGPLIGWELVHLRTPLQITPLHLTALSSPLLTSTAPDPYHPY
jgi:hypothetical protein